MKKVTWIFLALVLLIACGCFSLNYVPILFPARPVSHAIELADLDGDGDLDAFLANGRNEAPEPNTVLLNDGRGRFRDSGQRLGNFESWALALADYDGDGDSDALVSNISWGEYFWNDGRGHFEGGRSIMMPAREEGLLVGIWRFAAADLNADGRPDLFLTGCCGGGISRGPDDWQTLNALNTIWLSDGEVLPRDSGQQLGLGGTEAAVLADLDGDGDRDAFLVNSDHMEGQGEFGDPDPNEVWFNDGRGGFSDSGQRLGGQRSHAAALGDLDGDGDLDVLVGNRGPDEIWWNDGAGFFRQDAAALGNSLTRFLYLADLDGDGDLDALQGGETQGRIWLNDGRGRFRDSGQRLDYSRRHALALGDVNGDGAVDVIAGRLDKAIVWLNDGRGRLGE